MNFSLAFIRRPVATCLLMLSVLLLGLAGLSSLPIAALPQADLPTVQVHASLPGANPEVVASSVVAPIERQLALIPGVVEMTSTSVLGRGSISVQFNLNRNIDAAAQDVQAALNAAAGQLPKTLPTPPTYEKSNPADFQILSLAVTSDVLPLSEVDYYADVFLAQQLSRISGVGLVDLHGEQKRAVRVQINPTLASKIKISLEQLRAAIALATANTPKGTLDGPRQSLTLDSTDQLTNASAYDSTVVAYNNSAPVRIRDIGRAVDGVEDVKQEAWLQNQRAIIVDIHKMPGFNVVDTVNAIKAQLPGLSQSLPSSIKIQVVGDRTQTIRAALSDIELTLLISMALVVFVIFLFLRTIWATIIAAVAIPLSIVGTFGVMYLMGYSINNVSMMGLTIVVGFVIDDAIVMIENITTYIERGEAPFEAAVFGSRQVLFTIISMTLSLIAALTPLLFMGGIVGRLFREFSITISIALGISAVVSLTLTPMMCRVLLRPHSTGAQGTLACKSDEVYRKVVAFYERTLTWALARRPMVLAIAIVTAFVTLALYWYTPKGFFPQQDVGLIVATSEAAPGISNPAMEEKQLSIIEVVMADPDVDNVYSWIDGSNIGRFMINLKPFDHRKATAQQIINRLRAKMEGMKGVAFFMQARQDLSIGGRVSKSQYQYTLEDVNVNELYEWAPKIMQMLGALPQLRDVTSDMQSNAPKTTIAINRETAARFGITPQIIDDTLYDAFGQRPIATIFTQLDTYRVILEVDPSYKLDATALESIYVPSVTGQMVPLSAFASFTDSVVPIQINHQRQFPAITLSFNLAPGVVLGNAVEVVTTAIEEARLPATLHGSFQGTAQAFTSSLASQPFLIAAAIIAVYIVLGILYESFVHPLTILSTLPSAGLGAILALMLFHYEMSLIALVGIILLIGIVKKNAIMMIDFALELQRKDHLDAETAIRSACLRRFRPIMMTTAAAILASLPLAFGHGAGSELRAPLGVAIVGGLILSQMLTLYTTPVIYLYLDRFSRRFAPHLRTGAHNESAFNLSR